MTDTWAAVWSELRPLESYPWDFARGKSVGDNGASRRIAAAIADDDEIRRVVRCYLTDPWHASHGPTLSKLANALQTVRVQAASTAAQAPRQSARSNPKLDQLAMLKAMAGGTHADAHVIEGEYTEAKPGAGRGVQGGHGAGERRLLAGATG